MEEIQVQMMKVYSWEQEMVSLGKDKRTDLDKMKDTSHDVWYKVT